jgi:streptomycin 6-kinase
MSLDLARRIAVLPQQWRVAVEHVEETDGSVLLFGTQGDRPVVIKIIRERREEWNSGHVLMAFGGRGLVRVLEMDDGAVLLERVRPAISLVTVVDAGGDDRATAILAEVIARMKPSMLTDVPTAREWGAALGHAAMTQTTGIPVRVLERAQHAYAALCQSQQRPRLLHGDLHHENVLLDDERGWLAIDPKGLVAELEFEAGAALRNPLQRPDVFTNPTTIARRVNRFARELRLDESRIVAWAFAQSVLAVLWLVEDGVAVTADHRWLTLAAHLEPMVKEISRT